MTLLEGTAAWLPTPAIYGFRQLDRECGLKRGQNRLSVSRIPLGNILNMIPFKKRALHVSESFGQM